MDPELIERRLAALVESVPTPSGLDRWRQRAVQPQRPAMAPRALNLGIVMLIALIILALLPLLIPAASHQPLPTPTPHP